MTSARAHDPDVGRAVIQCGCGRAAAWNGPEAARARGWHGRYVDLEGGRVGRSWTCPDCWTPPPPHVAPLAMPMFLRALILNGPAELAEAQLELARSEPAKFATYLDALRQIVVRMPARRGKKGENRRRWEAWLKRERSRTQQRRQGDETA